MTEAEKIIDQLERAYQGDPWYGSPLKTILRGVTRHEALVRPIPKAHNVWELVLHITAWKQEVLERLRGKRAGEPAAGDWPPIQGDSDADWRHALDGLERSHTALVDEVRRSSDAVLDAPVLDQRNRALGTGLKQWQSLHGILQHDIYHTGQISLLLKAAR